MPVGRCKICRRVLGATETTVCRDANTCARAREAWKDDPCPVSRCEFPAAAHESPLVVDGALASTCPDGWETVRKKVM